MRNREGYILTITLFVLVIITLTLRENVKFDVKDIMEYAAILIINILIIVYIVIRYWGKK